MNFGKESKSKELFFFFFFFFFWGGEGGAGRGGGRVREREEGIPTEKKIGICLFFCAHALHKISSSCSSGSLALTQTKGVTDR